jgi:DUF4097 and DUF4098 domain-containing protein YvlB
MEGRWIMFPTHVRRDGASYQTLIAAVAVLVVSALLVGCDLVTCDQTADRSESVPVAGIESVRIIAEAGSLEVDGQTNLTNVDAEGIACASSSGDLDEIQFEITTSGSVVVIEARTPGTNSEFDVRITVPDSMLVEIEDGSGSIEVRSVAGLRVSDGSGDVDVSDVGENLVIVNDGSGDLLLSDVGGSVEIESDGSGSITVSGIGGDVLVGNDGSGSISVSDVAGDFEVRNDGSGGIDHSGIGGTIDIPED